ncbi:MAG: indole-3-glycerol phosphate synthase TrpC [Candidatus Cyclonatronum sp.]|uniref:indole-3-glycerol phosphate synthase TrpC n=1 Tax=Cyclonatronum sp. TaxID=3024185 RepID=UPI0025C037B9|nr:indole-3-glycerol phosphate synthase TrpC [Cyclonatronum sp.]MCH8485561.1 indole-3-glycerol phosphate synthase TrpC [Cyclonatronum sp.]
MSEFPFSPPTILDKIVAQTREDLHQKKKKIAASDFRSFPEYEAERRDFKAALRKEGSIRVIAEVKKASPSKGIIREDFDPVRIAVQYDEAGAAAISVLTEPHFFQGDLAYLRQIRPEVSVPLLRKDFIVDFYQIEEARASGADAILLIATITSGAQLSELLHAAQEAGLQCLVECYSRDEFEALSFSEVNIVGVNNRNLKTFEVNLHRGLELLAEAPKEVIKVSESGLSSPRDIETVLEYGIDAALIGEHFMRQPHPGDALKRLTEPFS